MDHLTAFFYRQPVVLDAAEHRHLHLQPGDARFAAANTSVPLVSIEFPDACHDYPIVFSRAADGGWMALAVTGLTEGRNAFVDEAGRWDARYVPASVRRYPFILAENGPGQFSIAIDTAASQIGETGEPLFDAEGKPGPVFKQILPLMEDFQRQVIATQSFLHRLDSAGLLVQHSMQVRTGDTPLAGLNGAWIVDESRLRVLNDQQILSLFRQGDLALIHAHLLSLRNLVGLVARGGSSTTPADGMA